MSCAKLFSWVYSLPGNTDTILMHCDGISDMKYFKTSGNNKYFCMIKDASC